MEIPEILTQNDLNQTFDDKGKEITDISDLVLVHKTNFIPENGVIKSSRDAGALLDDYFEVGGEGYSVKYLYERNTVHFCVNGEVASHSLGDWDKTKYIIITPFDKADKTSFVGGMAVDLYTEGSFVIPEGSYILCPRNEMELVKNMNPTLKTIGYEGEYAKGYGDFLIRLLGYKKESIGAWAWSNENDGKIFIEILKEMGLRSDAHFGSKEAKRDFVLTEMNAICEILKTVKQQGLIVDSKTYDEVNEEISTRIRREIDTFLTPNMLDVFFEKLEKQSEIIISDEMKDRIKESKEKLLKEKEYVYYFNTAVITREGEEVTVLTDNYSFALKNICKEIADCCLYPKKQEIIMDEWISKYKEIENGAERVTSDTINEQLNELANMLPLEILKNEDLLQIFWSKIDNAGIEISENEKKLIVNLMNDIEQDDTIVASNYDIALKNLCKGITDCCLYPKKMDEWISKYKEIENGAERVTSDTINEQLNELANMLPLEILKNEDLLQIFWSKIDNAGIEISENEKKLIVNLMNDIEQDTPNSKEFKGFINTHCSNEEQIYSRILSKNLELPEERANLDETISNYCLYQINQENIIAEWCKGYVELEKTLELCSKEERIIKLNELAAKFPEKIFTYQDREFIQQFWNEITNVGINLTEKDKEIIQGVANNIAVEKNDEMGTFMMSCAGYSQGEIASRILCKGLQDGVILNKRKSEITYWEDSYIMTRLDACEIQRENYEVRMGDVPYVQITKRDSLESISQRIKGMPQITAKNMATYETTFLEIQESETIGEYIERMGECISLIDRYIRGEDIEFDEYGQSIETTREATKTEQSRQNLLESAIEATIDAKITTEEKEAAKKTIISIENAKNRENEIYQNNEEMSN